jgi:hypothetical protein
MTEAPPLLSPEQVDFKRATAQLGAMQDDSSPDRAKLHSAAELAREFSLTTQACASMKRRG